MSPFKKLLSNIKSTKQRDGNEPEPLVPSSLARSNARLFKKRNGTRETLNAVDSAACELAYASSKTTASNAAPIFLKDSSRSYSFEPGASVENFEAELEVHSKRLPRKLKKQNTSESLHQSTLKPKFGLKVNNAKLPGLSHKAASTLDLSVRNERDSFKERRPALGRYGLEVHPDNIEKCVIKGGCWEYIPDPPLDPLLPSQTSSSAASSDYKSATADPFEEAKLASERWNRPISFEARRKSSESPRLSSHGNRRRSSASIGGVRLPLNQLDNDLSIDGRELERRHDSQILHGSPSDSAISFSLADSTPTQQESSSSTHRGGKGKARQTDDYDERALSAMPGSFPSEIDIMQKVPNVRSRRFGSAYSRSTDDLQPQIASTPNPVMEDNFRAQLMRMRDLDQENEDREKAAAIQLELQRQQEEADHVAAAEADRLSAEAVARLAEEEARQRLRECVACAAKPPTSQCEHDVHTCSECLQSWMASEFDSKGTDNVKCPECPSTLQYNDVRMAASTQTFEAYDKLATRNALGALDEFSWCLGVNCGSGQLNVGNNDFMDCVSCGCKQCLKHKVAWHKGETCKQYDYRTSGKKARDEERATEKMIDKVSKKCPGKDCGWRIQKTDGCEHMTCKKCRHQFCWQCLAAQSEIKRVGNTAHAKTCKFHSTNLDLAFPFNAH